MDFLTDLLADVEERIDRIKTIGDVNNDLVKIAVNNLESIRKDLLATGRNIQITKKVERQIKMYKSVSHVTGVAEKLPIIYEQMVVLMIGALEVYLADIFRQVGDRMPEYLVWKAEKEKISFEPTLLSEGFTLGDAILSHLKNQGISFQDLQSTLRAFEKYFDVKVVLDEKNTDKLILAAACRNVIVHNRSEIDNAFRKQIRSTRYAEDIRFQKGKKLNIDEKYIEELGETLKGFCRDITVLLMQRDE